MEYLTREINYNSATTLPKTVAFKLVVMMFFLDVSMKGRDLSLLCGRYYDLPDIRRMLHSWWCPCVPYRELVKPVAFKLAVMMFFLNVSMIGRDLSLLSKNLKKKVSLFPP